MTIFAACGGSASANEKAFSKSQIVEECTEWLALQSAKDETEIQDNFTTKGSGACISGDIDEDLQEKVVAWLGTVPSKTKPIVVIRSGGGNAFPAIDIAETLQERDAEVYITEVCASSCANYIYAGVRQRHSLGTTILLFHGGLTEETAEDMLKSFDEFLSGPDGHLAENPDEVRKQLVEDTLLYVQKQNNLLIAAGVDPVLIHGFSDMRVSDLASEDCDPEGEPDLEYAVFFSKEMARSLGILPVTGSLEYRADVINERMNRSGEGNKACMAPDKFFRSAEP